MMYVMLLWGKFITFYKGTISVEHRALELTI